jgi:hypothetical protein
MAKYTFAQLPEWVRKQKELSRAVLQASAQELARRANLQGPSVARGGGGAGGRMPIDTGFLVNTFAAQIGGMPSGPSRPGEGSPGDWEVPTTLVIAGMKAGDTLFMGWTAAYARRQEERYGFMKGAAAQWQSVVDGVVADARARAR